MPKLLTISKPSSIPTVFVFYFDQQLKKLHYFYILIYKYITHIHLNKMLTSNIVNGVNGVSNQKESLVCLLLNAFLNCFLSYWLVTQVIVVRLLVAKLDKTDTSKPSLTVKNNNIKVKCFSYQHNTDK